MQDKNNKSISKKDAQIAINNLLQLRNKYLKSNNEKLQNEINKNNKEIENNDKSTLKYLEVYNLMFKYKDEYKEIYEIKEHFNNFMDGSAKDDKDGNELEEILYKHYHLKYLPKIYNDNKNITKILQEYSYQIFELLAENCQLYVFDDFESILKNEIKIEEYETKIKKII